MPQIKFTDTNVKTLSADKTTWFTDLTCKGLRLCVTKGGVKTWYVNKWDPKSQKTRSIKLAQWANKGAHCRWAKEHLGKVTLDIQEGNVLTRAERDADVLARGIPTFAQALDQFITHRRGDRASGKAPMTETTEKDYRGSFSVHFHAWADMPVDALPILEINQYLNKLQLTKPQGAARAATVGGVVVRFVNKLCALALPIPGLLDPTKPRSRVETGKLDMSVPFADRWSEIEQVENEHKRLAWQIIVYTGFRSRPLRELTWSDVDLDEGSVTLKRPVKKKVGDRTVYLSDDALRLFKRLWEIRYDDCDWVFPSRRIIGVRGHLDALDRLPLTAAGDIRHYWMTAAREVAQIHIIRWLALHTMTGDDLRMVGHYGEPSPNEQRRGAEAIAAAINSQFGITPSSVVELKRNHA